MIDGRAAARAAPELQRVREVGLGTRPRTQRSGRTDSSRLYLGRRAKRRFQVASWSHQITEDATSRRARPDRSTSPMLIRPMVRVKMTCERSSNDWAPAHESIAGPVIFVLRRMPVCTSCILRSTKRLAYKALGLQSAWPSHLSLSGYVQIVGGAMTASNCGSPQPAS